MDAQLPGVWIWTPDKAAVPLECELLVPWKGREPTHPQRCCPLTDLSNQDGSTMYVTVKEARNDEELWACLRECASHQDDNGFVLVFVRHASSLPKPAACSAWTLCVLQARHSTDIRVEDVVGAQIGGARPASDEDVPRFRVAVEPFRLDITREFAFCGRLVTVEPQEQNVFVVEPRNQENVFVYCISNSDFARPGGFIVLRGKFLRMPMLSLRSELRKDDKVVPVCNSEAPFHIVAIEEEAIDLCDTFVREGFVVIDAQKPVNKWTDVYQSVCALLNSSGGVIVLRGAATELRIQAQIYGTADVDFLEGKPRTRHFGCVWVSRERDHVVLYVHGSPDHVWFHTNEEFEAYKRHASPKPETLRMEIREFLERFRKVPLESCKAFYFSSAPPPSCLKVLSKQFDFGKSLGPETLSREWKSPPVLDLASISAFLPKSVTGMLNSRVEGRIGVGISDDGLVIGSRVLPEDLSSEEGVSNSVASRVQLALSSCRPAFQYHVEVSPVCLGLADPLIVFEMPRADVEMSVQGNKKITEMQRLKYLLKHVLDGTDFVPLVLHAYTNTLVVGIFKLSGGSVNKDARRSLESKTTGYRRLDSTNFTKCRQGKCVEKDHQRWVVFVNVKASLQNDGGPYVCEFPGKPLVLVDETPRKIPLGRMSPVSVPDHVFASRLCQAFPAKLVAQWRRKVCFFDSRYETALIVSAQRWSQVSGPVTHLMEGPWSLIVALVTEYDADPSDGVPATRITINLATRQQWFSARFGERDQRGEPSPVLLLVPWNGEVESVLSLAIREIPSSGRQFQVAVVNVTHDSSSIGRLTRVAHLFHAIRDASVVWVGIPPWTGTEAARRAEHFISVLDQLRIDDLVEDLKNRDQDSYVLHDGQDMSANRKSLSRSWLIFWPRFARLTVEAKKDAVRLFLRGAEPQPYIFLDQSVFLSRKLLSSTKNWNLPKKVRFTLPAPNGVEALAQAVLEGFKRPGLSVVNLWHECCSGATTLAYAALVQLRTKATCIVLRKKDPLDERAEQMLSNFRVSQESQCCVLLDSTRDAEVSSFVENLHEISRGQTDRIVVLALRSIEGTSATWQKKREERLKCDEWHFLLNSELDKSEQETLLGIYRTYGSEIANRLVSDDCSWSSRLPHLALLAFGDKSGELGSWGEKVDIFVRSLHGTKFLEPLALLMALFWLERLVVSLPVFLSMCGLRSDGVSPEIALPLAVNVLFVFSAKGEVRPVHAAVAERVLLLSANMHSKVAGDFVVELCLRFLPDLICESSEKEQVFTILTKLRSDVSPFRCFVCSDGTDRVTKLLSGLRSELHKIATREAKWGHARLCHLTANVFRANWYRRQHVDWAKRAMDVLDCITFEKDWRHYESEVQNTRGLVAMHSFIEKCEESEDYELLDEKGNLSERFTELLQVAVEGWNALRQARGIVSGSSQETFERNNRLNEFPPLTMYEFALHIYREISRRVAQPIDAENFLSQFTGSESDNQIELMLSQLTMVRENEHYLQTLLPQSDRERNFGSRFAECFTKFANLLVPLSLFDLAEAVKKYETQAEICLSFRRLYVKRSLVGTVPGIGPVPGVVETALGFLRMNLRKDLPYDRWARSALQFVEFCLLRAVPVPQEVFGEVGALLDEWSRKVDEACVQDVRPLVYAIAFYCPSYERQTMPWSHSTANVECFERALKKLISARQTYGLTLVLRVCVINNREVPFLGELTERNEALFGALSRVEKLRRGPESEEEDFWIKPLEFRGKVQSVNNELFVLWGRLKVPIFGQMKPDQMVSFSLGFGPTGVKAFYREQEKRRKKKY